MQRVDYTTLVRLQTLRVQSIVRCLCMSAFLLEGGCWLQKAYAVANSCKERPYDGSCAETNTKVPACGCTEGLTQTSTPEKLVCVPVLPS